MLLDWTLRTGRIVWIWVAGLGLPNPYLHHDDAIGDRIEMVERVARHLLESSLEPPPPPCATGKSLLCTIREDGALEYTCMGDICTRPIEMDEDGVYVRLTNGERRQLTLEPCDVLRAENLPELLREAANRGDIYVAVATMTTRGVEPALVRRSELLRRRSSPEAAPTSTTAQPSDHKPGRRKSFTARFNAGEVKSRYDDDLLDD